MRIFLAAILLMFGIICSQDNPDSSIFCTIHHPVKDVKFKSNKHSIIIEYVDSTLQNIKIDLDVKYLTCGIKWIDKWSLKILEWNKYDKIKFNTTNIKKISSNSFIATGIIDFHGVKKVIDIPLEYADGAWYGKFDLCVNDFKLIKPRPFGIYINDYVIIELRIFKGER